jgi:hypothetical protein
VKILADGANCLVLTKVDADLAPSAEEDRCCTSAVRFEA